MIGVKDVHGLLLRLNVWRAGTGRVGGQASADASAQDTSHLWRQRERGESPHGHSAGDAQGQGFGDDLIDQIHGIFQVDV